MKKVVLFICFIFIAVNVFSQRNFKDFRERENSRIYNIRNIDYHFTYEAIRDTKSIKMKKLQSHFKTDCPESLVVEHDIHLKKYLLNNI